MDRGSVPAPKRRYSALRALAGRAASTLAGLAAVAGRALARLARISVRAAKAVGEVAVGAWHSVVGPLLGPIVRGIATALGIAERVVTPARALAVVAVAAAITLGGSQFSDYRAVEVGAPEYRGIEAIAQAPELDSRSPRSAHGPYVLAIAIAAGLVSAIAVARNWRLARLLSILGAAAVVISLVVDAPEGLREGNLGVAYQGANAVLLGGFWAQLSSGVTLIVVGPLLALQLRDERDLKRARRARRRSKRGGARPSLAGSPEGSGAERAAT